MTVRDTVRSLTRNSPVLRSAAKNAELQYLRFYNAAAQQVPTLVNHKPRQITIAVTANCNLRCKGCNYPKGFMGGATLPLETIELVLADSAAAGISTVRFFGGEPLLHPRLPEMISRAKALGMEVYITTNGTHLKSKIDALYAAGLRFITMGFYGVGSLYDEYTQRRGHFARLHASLEYVRQQYGKELELQLNFVLMRPTCNVEAVDAAWEFARKFDLLFHVDPVSYTLPFFNNGPEQELPFVSGDEVILAPVIERLLQHKAADPARFLHSTHYIRSLPDWLLRQSEMLMPCHANRWIWVGADGTVQLCDTALPLGNLHRTRLKDILGTEVHKKACRDAFEVRCPNCVCGSEARIIEHWPSVMKYRN